MNHDDGDRLPSLDFLATPLVGNVDTVTVVSGTDEQRQAIVTMLAQELERFGTQIRQLNVQDTLDLHISQQTDLGRDAKLFLDNKNALPDKMLHAVFERGMNKLMLDDINITPRSVWAVNYPMTMQQAKMYRITMANDRYIDRNDMLLSVRQNQANGQSHGMEANLVIDFDHPDGIRHQIFALFKEY